MAKGSKLKRPLEWREMSGEDGTVLGHYAIDGGMIVVRSVQGWERRTQLGNPETHAGLARLILSEGPPMSFQRP